MSAERVSYLDSSAIVKLVVKEQESAALRRYLRGRQALQVDPAALTLLVAHVRRKGRGRTAA